MKILIAEDDLDMQKIIRLYLEQAGHQADTVSNGAEALDQLGRENYALLIVDWMMPEMDGISLVREVRMGRMPIKIIMLTAKSEIEDEISGLRNGADDYIRKPFEPKLLLVKIEKMFHLNEVLRCGKLSLNPQNHAVMLADQEIKLTQKEYILLHTLMINQGITLSRETLLTSVWGDSYDGDERTLDTHIKRLRNKIGKACITTHVGIGYRMEEPDE